MNRGWFLAIALLLSAPAQAAPLLLIGLDGLRTSDITDATPNLRALFTAGAHASGARSMVPGLTYVSYTTMLTGAAPAVNGIVENVMFDPLQKNMDGWYWYAGDVKVPTLWDRVQGEGGVTANLGFGTAVGARGIDINLPEYRRARTADNELIRALSSPRVPQFEKDAGVSYETAMGGGLAADQARAKLAAAVIARAHPRFTTVHFGSLDGTEHRFGPDTPQAKATLEAMDAVVGTLVGSARASEPGLVVAVASDHGFAPVTKEINIFAAFAQAGLVSIDPVTHKVASWEAEPWYAGGSDFIVLARPDDTALEAKVAGLLAKLQADPANGIESVLDRAALAKLGAAPQASFLVEFSPGYQMGRPLEGPVVAPSVEKGGHGYLPDRAGMDGVFFIAGPGIAADKSLGRIDMRDIGPTLGKILGVTLPAATNKPLF